MGSRRHRGRHGPRRGLSAEPARPSTTSRRCSWSAARLAPADERSVAVVGTRQRERSGSAQGRRDRRRTSSRPDTSWCQDSPPESTAQRTAPPSTPGGRTIAVIGTGLRHAFPKENAELQDRLGREHAVISQFWPDQGPRKHTFPMRNAVMSGISRATVVVEASYTSGARMQARLALEHGRPVVLLRHAGCRARVGPGVRGSVPASTSSSASPRSSTGSTACTRRS